MLEKYSDMVSNPGSPYHGVPTFVNRPGFGVLSKQGSTFMDEGEMFSVKYDDMLKFS